MPPPLFFFDLDQPVGFINRLGYKGVGAAQHEKSGGDGGHEPAVLHDNGDNLAYRQPFVFVVRPCYLLAWDERRGLDVFVFH
jgi:hypothetical protein